CIREMPLLARAAADLDGEVAFLGVDVQDQDAKAMRLAREAGVAYPLVRDPAGRLFTSLHGAGMPTTLFVDADGTVVYRRTGEVDAERFRELLREHLGVLWTPPAPAQDG
ncbi:MAG TPA: TlpA disulfide reductase family protein, partial [Egibacteraceae bacterium]|nr:TlpA disulfide reductase family protein [Egibacteraceae bacterium]